MKNFFKKHKNGAISIVTVVLWITFVIMLMQPTAVVENVPESLGQSFEDKVNTGVSGDSYDEISKTENNPSMWKKGAYSGTGSFYTTSIAITTKDYVPEGTHLVYAEDNYVFYAIVYDENDNYLGFWDGSDIVQSVAKTMCYINPEGLAPNKLKIVVKKNDNTTITVEECSNIHFLNKTASEAFSSRPTLTFIDDDGSKEALENWESICDEVGVNITSALVTNIMGDDDDPDRTKASWSDVARLQSKGFEFVSHTANHIKITESTDEKCIQQFESSIASLREHGCEYRYLVYPYNAIDTDKIPLVKQYFEAGIGLGGYGSDNKLPLQTHNIRRYSINDINSLVQVERNGNTVEAYAFKDIDTLKDYIDDAITNNSWVIIMTHLRNESTFYFDDTTRENIIELCNYATQKGVKINTFGEAFERFKNQSEEGSIYDTDAAYKIVDCNGVLHYKN